MDKKQKVKELPQAMKDVEANVTSTEATKKWYEHELENVEADAQAIVEQRKASITARAEFLGRFTLRGEVLKFVGLKFSISSPFMVSHHVLPHIL